MFIHLCASLISLFVSSPTFLLLEGLFTRTMKNMSRNVARHGATMTENFLIVSRDIARQEVTKISLLV
jgi:hypothetical protein